MYLLIYYATYPYTTYACITLQYDTKKRKKNLKKYETT